MTLPWLDAICTDLSTRIDSGRFGHAPLIHGPAGTGKTALGEWLARRLLCLSPAAGQPCAQCKACRLIDSGTHPDLFVVAVAEDKRSIEVDQVRNLSERLQLTASLGAHRVGLIAAADAMNQNAANALLKTLEEPPAGAWLILLSQRPARLAATVRSRCQPLALQPPPESVGLAWLAEACPDAAPNSRRAALALCGGAPLAAREMLDSGGLESGMAILADLSGQRAFTEILKTWQSDPAATWQWLARWLSMLMHRASGSDDVWQPDDLAMPSVTDQRALARLWQQALSGGLEAERGAVRQDLLLGRWLLEWETLQRVGI